MRNKIVEKIRKNMINRTDEGDQDLQTQSLQQSNEGGKKKVHSQMSGNIGIQKVLKDRLGRSLGVNDKVLKRIEKYYK